MGYPVKAVANGILRIAEEHRSAISPLKLQKLVYISHGWYLGLTGKPLISDELAEAWQYGPVFPSLYHEFKEFGRGSINQRATEFDLSSRNFDIVEPEIPDDDKYTWALLNKVWAEYGKFTGGTLSDLTHRDNTPWEETWRNSRGVKNTDIPNELIEAHYKQLAKQNRPAS